MSAAFTATVEIAAPVERVWARLTDWPAHGRWIPFTTVRVVTPTPDEVGSVFLGRSGVGPLGFDDPMEIVDWRPPAAGGSGFCRVHKLGRVVLGDAEFEVIPLNDGTTRLIWKEEVEVAPVWLTAPAGPLIAVAGRFAFTRALRAMAREVEDEVPAGG